MGNYDVTKEILEGMPEIGEIKIGLCNLFIQHTSASLCIMENWDDSVKTDIETWLDKVAPMDESYSHSCEGKDDMPAHIKTAILGPSHSIPITAGKLNLGTWQGIWLNEHRLSKNTRKVVVTVQG
eukprot:CAMPEP_0168329836 /NCGR_PEP_ID=MMETSP0213-20121227/7351_1 /TAXON_ID=151035 /ORGANISM="Euplotes harpa, Strain FSP1.4" /LENGTH=124 /DNA_ID=CAMNT_0008333249 /DNA_START=69 /DNA_END=443 /DNA_ORIENTATION=+